MRQVIIHPGEDGYWVVGYARLGLIGHAVVVR